MRGYVFPGQGAQFPGMCRSLYESNREAHAMLEAANGVLGFDIVHVMLEGTREELRETRVTQPAVFLHSVVLAKLWPGGTPEVVAGHSLGEFSALVASGAVDFEQGLQLVLERALAMQAACEMTPSTMAAVLGLAAEEVERVCASVSGVVVPANYNSPGQVVISGTEEAVAVAGEALKKAGARRVLPLEVGGAFHSPLMEPARVRLAEAIERTRFATPVCPVYQNVDAQPHTRPDELKRNLLVQLTAPVRWMQIVEKMASDGVTQLVELGPGSVLQGLVEKTTSSIAIESHQEIDA